MIEALLKSIFRRVIRSGNLSIKFPSGQTSYFGDGIGELVTASIQDNATMFRLACQPTLALGELLTNGQITVSRGSIFDFINLISQNIGTGVPDSLLPIYNTRRHILTWLQGNNTLWRARRNVEHHYDLDRRLYDLFLDADRQYSCAYFESDHSHLEDAQLAKKRHIAAKLILKPGQNVLDIGCGWGGLALYLAQNCDVRVVGITLSSEQLQVALRRATEQRLSHSIKFRLEDYRAVSGTFDRIVSVGMFEHVGPKNYANFFRQSYNLLSDDGVMLLHTIGRSDGPSPTNPWLEKYIFPGSYAPALSEITPIIERSGFIVSDIEVLRLHYAQTLRAWRERFLANRAKIQLLYDDRFCRMWETYLAACEAGFRHGGLVVFQFQLIKRQETIPLTRDYINASETALRQVENRRSSKAITPAAE
jgi:cyclopropane-fatty-acyl-phospholipid synthase